MNIGKASKLTGLAIRTMHYYEEVGLIAPARRKNGYRDYSENDVHKLGFLQRARSLGFSIEECRTLLTLYNDRNRASADVKRIAAGHLCRVETKLNELVSLRNALSHLIECCDGDQRPDCPILDDLAGLASRSAESTT